MVLYLHTFDLYRQDASRPIDSTLPNTSHMEFPPINFDVLSDIATMGDMFDFNPLLDATFELFVTGLLPC